MDKEKELERIKRELVEREDNIAELQRIVDKEIIKTIEWVVSVMEGDNSKSCLRDALNTATTILDDLNKLQNILKKP